MSKQKFFLWIHDHPNLEGDVVKVGVGPAGISLQHIMAPETLEVMNGHNNTPKIE